MVKDRARGVGSWRRAGWQRARRGGGRPSAAPPREPAAGEESFARWTARTAAASLALPGSARRRPTYLRSIIKLSARRSPPRGARAPRLDVHAPPRRTSIEFSPAWRPRRRAELDCRRLPSARASSAPRSSARASASLRGTWHPRPMTRSRCSRLLDLKDRRPGGGGASPAIRAAAGALACLDLLAAAGLAAADARARRRAKSPHVDRSRAVWARRRAPPPPTRSRAGGPSKPPTACSEHAWVGVRPQRRR